MAHIYSLQNDQQIKAPINNTCGYCGSLADLQNLGNEFVPKIKAQFQVPVAKACAKLQFSNTAITIYYKLYT